MIDPGHVVTYLGHLVNHLGHLVTAHVIPVRGADTAPRMAGVTSRSEVIPLTPAVFHILLALADRELHRYGIMKQVAVCGRRHPAPMCGLARTAEGWEIAQPGVSAGIYQI